MRECRIAENVGMGLRKIGGSLAIESTTIWENSDPPWPHLDCGGLCVDYVDADIRNSIIWNDDAETIDDWGSTLDIEWCDISGGWPGEGNIDADPLFATWHGRPCALRPASPCIDSGDPTLGFDGIDWPPRYDNDSARADMGAYGARERMCGCLEGPCQSPEATSLAITCRARVIDNGSCGEQASDKRRRS